MTDKEMTQRINQLELDILRLKAQNNMMKLLLCGSLETFSKRLDLYAAQVPAGWKQGRITRQTSPEKVSALRESLSGGGGKGRD